MPLMTKDVRVQGYPPLDLILSHFDSLPVLIQAVKQHCPEVLAEWDKLRNLGRPPTDLVPATRSGELALHGSTEYD